MQPCGHLLDSSDSPPLLPFDFFPVLAENQGGIVSSHLYHFFLGSLFRNPNMHLLAPPAGQPTGDYLFVFNFFLKDQFMGDKRRAGVKLFQKAGHHLSGGVSFCHPRIKVIAPNQASVPDKKDLDNGILLIHGHGNHIAVFSSVSGNFLPLADPFDTLDQIAVFHGVFKAQLLRSLLHLLL